MRETGGTALGGGARSSRTDVFVGRCVRVGLARLVPICRTEIFVGALAGGRAAGGAAQVEVVAAVVRDPKGTVRLSVVGEGDPAALWERLTQETPGLSAQVWERLA